MLKVHDIVKVHDLRRRATAAIAACMQEAPFIRVRSARKSGRRRDAGADLVLNLRTKAGSSARSSSRPRLGPTPSGKRSGQPASAPPQRIPRRLRRIRSAYVSPESAEICKKDGIGYLDLAGNCRLSFDQVFISREGFRNRFTKRRDLRSLYAPKATRVLRVLLMASPNGGRPRHWPTRRA